MKRHMDSAGWSWSKFKDYYFPGGKRVLLTRRDRSIQRTVDLLEAMEEGSNNGDLSSLSTSERIPRLPSASSVMRRGSRGIRIPRIRIQVLPDYSSSSEAPGTTWSRWTLPGEATFQGRSISPKPTSDPQHGSSETQDGDSGPPGTKDSAGDSEREADR